MRNNYKDNYSHNCFSALHTKGKYYSVYYKHALPQLNLFAQLLKSDEFWLAVPLCFRYNCNNNELFIIC